MRKFLFRLTTAIACIALLISSNASFAYAFTYNNQAQTGFLAEDLLRTKGKKIVNKKGETVTIKGVNLGGWLIHEQWFCPVNKDDNITTMEVLSNRFGEDKAYELINQYEDNWITESDLDNIKDLGFNCVRVPFWYRNFYYDDAGRKILDKDGNWDFSRLDWIVNECSKRRIYVILDLHGAPGYQSNAAHSGKTDSCGLFKLTKQAEEYRKITTELWTAIAKRYNNNPAIAMYDLLNEPMCDVKSYLVKNNFSTISMYNRLYKAIRNVDSNHIISIEAIWRLYNVPAPYIMGWSNVVYQLHLYNKTNFEFLMNIFISKLYPYNVPIYIGEFKSLGSADWGTILRCFNNAKYSWSTWTYKGFGDGATSNDWFLYGSNSGEGRVDIYNDSFETIMTKWGTALRTDSNYTLTGLDSCITPYI